MVTSQTFLSHKLITVDRDQDPFSLATFGTTAQTPDSQETFIMKISENEFNNTITYLVGIIEGVIT